MKVMLVEVMLVEAMLVLATVLSGVVVVPGAVVVPGIVTCVVVPWLVGGWLVVGWLDRGTVVAWLVLVPVVDAMGVVRIALMEDAGGPVVGSTVAAPISQFVPLKPRKYEYLMCHEWQK